MKRALALALVLLIAGAGIVAADAFPFNLGLQPELARGPGWRVIYADFPADSRFAYRVELATDDASFSALWSDVAGPSRPARPENLERNVVALFAVGTGSCTTGASFDGLVFAEQRLVHAEISTSRKCPFLDLNGAAVFLVAIARDRLPESPFTLQLEPQPTCGSCADPADRLTVDL